MPYSVQPPSVRFGQRGDLMYPISGLLEPSLYLEPFWRYWAVIMRSHT